MAIGSIKSAPIPSIIHTARQELAKLNEDCSRFSIDAINRFKTIQLQVADLQGQFDILGGFKGNATSGSPSVIDAGDAAILGVSLFSAPVDHQHRVDTGAPPIGIGAGNTEGTSTDLARADHDHTWRETSGPQDLTAGAILAGDTVRRVSNALVGRQIETKRLGSTQSTSSTTLADVHPDLSFDLISGRQYFFLFWLPYQTAAVGTGIQLAINYSGTLTSIRYGLFGATAAATTHSQSTSTVDTALGNATAGPGGTDRIMILGGDVRPSSNGTLALRFATGVAASSVTIANSSRCFLVQT